MSHLEACTQLARVWYHLQCSSFIQCGSKESLLLSSSCVVTVVSFEVLSGAIRFAHTNLVPHLLYYFTCYTKLAVKDRTVTL